MHHKGSLRKLWLIVLIALILLLSAGLASPSAHKVAADDLPPAVQLYPVHGVPGEDYVADQIIVKFREGVLSTAERQLNENQGTSVVHTSPRAPDLRS